MLKGFEKAHSSSKEQIEIASRQIVEFIFKQQRTGLVAFQNRIQTLPEPLAVTMTSPDNWVKGGQTFDLVRHTFQEWRRMMKKHVRSLGSLDTYVWPDPPEQSTPVIQELLEFEKKFLQDTAVDRWYTVDSSNATTPDTKYTAGIIKAFWLGKDQYPVWLADHAVWAMRQEFEKIMNQMYLHSQIISRSLTGIVKKLGTNILIQEMKNMMDSMGN